MIEIIDRPKLSVLIPTYEYVIGVRRIIDALEDELPSSVEVLIFDDSISNEIALIFSKNLINHNIHYKKNDVNLGPARNWNSLLESARGEFCILMHHDEYPIGENFLKRVLQELNNGGDSDVIVMDCLLAAKDGRVLRRHLPNVLRQLIMNFAPTYIFRRNPIGPTSVLIVRRAVYPRFDSNLHWMVDVDAFYRLRMLTPSWRFCESLKIASVFDRADSITATIGNNIGVVERRELSYLRGKYNDPSLWLCPSKNRFIFVLESILWISMRLITRIHMFVFKSFRKTP